MKIPCQRFQQIDQISHNVYHYSNVLQKVSPTMKVSRNVTHSNHSFDDLSAPKIVHFESKWVGSLSLIIKLSLAVGCLYLMFQRNSYQIFDRSPISAVTVKVKQGTYCSGNFTTLRYFPKYNCTKSLYDVNDYILPATENSAVSITTRMVETEHILKECRRSKTSSRYTSFAHQCNHESRCILHPFYRTEYDPESFYKKRDLCWFPSPERNIRWNYEALDYIIFIKHFIEFPQLGLKRHNLESRLITMQYLNTCEYDRIKHPLCPKFRVLKILEMVEPNSTNYESMLFHGSLIEIQISWKCDLDRAIKYCEPTYAFNRSDIQPYDSNPYEPGSNFLTSKHFFRPNDRQLHRIHTEIYKLHIIISVTGEAGRFDLFQTTTSIGSFLGIFGTGAIVCDIIASSLSNFKRVKYDK